MAIDRVNAPLIIEAIEQNPHTGLYRRRRYRIAPAFDKAGEYVILDLTGGKCFRFSTRDQAENYYLDNELHDVFL